MDAAPISAAVLLLLCAVACTDAQVDLLPLGANETPLLPRHRGELPAVGAPPESGVDIPGRPTLQRHKLGWPHDNKPAVGRPLPPPDRNGHHNVPDTCLQYPHYTPCASEQQANANAAQCCIDKGLPSGCAALCNLDATLDDISISVTGGDCPFDSVKDVLSCVGNKQDARQCCSDLGVGHAGYREPCLRLCAGEENVEQPHLFPQFQLELVKCLHVFETVKRCLHAAHPDPNAPEKSGGADAKADRLAELLGGALQAGRGVGGPDLEFQ